MRLFNFLKKEKNNDEHPLFASIDGFLSRPEAFAGWDCRLFGQVIIQVFKYEGVNQWESRSVDFGENGYYLELNFNKNKKANLNRFRKAPFFNKFTKIDDGGRDCFMINIPEENGKEDLIKLIIEVCREVYAVKKEWEIEYFVFVPN